MLSITSNVDPLAPHSFSFVSSSSNTKTWDEEGGKERLSRKDLDVLEEDDENEIEEEDDENVSCFLFNFFFFVSLNLFP